MTEVPIKQAAHDAARQAWESFGQFTVPDTGRDDPDGRAVLYIAGYLARVYAEAQQRTALVAVVGQVIEELETTDRNALLGTPALHRALGRAAQRLRALIGDNV